MRSVRVIVTGLAVCGALLCAAGAHAARSAGHCPPASAVARAFGAAGRWVLAPASSDNGGPFQLYTEFQPLVVAGRCDYAIHPYPGHPSLIDFVWLRPPVGSPAYTVTDAVSNGGAGYTECLPRKFCAADFDQAGHNFYATTTGWSYGADGSVDTTEPDPSWGRQYRVGVDRKKFVCAVSSTFEARIPARGVTRSRLRDILAFVQSACR